MYVKLFASILDSSVWAEDQETRLLWITMLVKADREGVVRASTTGLARAANISVESCKRGIDVLQAPDLDSKDPDYGGRRIEKIDGGWVVLNLKKYREIRTNEQLQAAERQRRHRALPVTHVTLGHGDPVSASASASEKPEADTEIARAERTAEADVETPTPTPLLDAIARTMAPHDLAARRHLDGMSTPGRPESTDWFPTVETA